MKKLHLLLIITLLSVTGYSQVTSDCTAPSILLSEYEKDVKDIALKRIIYFDSEDAGLIDIPSAWQDTVLAGLAAIFNSFSIPERDTVFDIHCIHNSSPINSKIYKRIMVKVNESYGWPLAWASLNTVTGNAAVDELVNTYGFTVVSYSSFSDVATLETDQLINAIAFCEQMALNEGVIYAEPSYGIGDANQINYSRIGDNLFFTFSVKWDDCPSGCINRYMWHFFVDYNTCETMFTGAESYISTSAPIPDPSYCNITGIKTPKTEVSSDWVVFPNPATNIINIKTGNQAKIEIINSEGKIKFRKNTDDIATSIDISEYKSGLYLVKLSDGSSIRVFKIIKE